MIRWFVASEPCIFYLVRAHTPTRARYTFVSSTHSHAPKLQVWATWLFYTVLVDLGNVIADELSLPFERISLAMVYRCLCHFNVAHNEGKATDPVKYFAAKEDGEF